MGHGHLTVTGRQRGRLGAVLAVTVAVLAAEVAGGLVTGSLALLADAGHVAADAAGIGLSLFAAHVATRPATTARTFGYARAEILAATVNGLLLFGVGIFILAEAVLRLISPPAVAPRLMMVFGLIALAGNGVSLFLLLRPLQPGPADRPAGIGAGGAPAGGPWRPGESLNVRGAVLEVGSDALGAVAVIVAGAVIVWTGFTRADPIASLALGSLILPRTWRLLREALNVLLEGSPRGVDTSEVRRHLTEVDGVIDVHDLHAWTITSGHPVLSAHVVVDAAVLADGRSAGTLDRLQECLRGHFDVEHSTFQLEPAGHADHEPSACD
jgi:cobalt-zinc-cadmium efflux system protein